MTFIISISGKWEPCSRVLRSELCVADYKSCETTRDGRSSLCVLVSVYTCMYAFGGVCACMSLWFGAQDVGTGAHLHGWNPSPASSPAL